MPTSIQSIQDLDALHALRDKNRSVFDAIYTNKLGMPAPSEIETADELLNVTCYEWLLNVARKIPALLRVENEKNIYFYLTYLLCAPPNQYNPSIPYGNIYTNFLLSLQKYVSDCKRRDDKINLNKLNDLIVAVYINSNFALERAADMTKIVVQDVNVSQTDERKFKDAVNKRLSRGGKGPVKRRGGANVTTPLVAGSIMERLKSVIGPDFNPMTTTSLPSKVYLKYKEPGDPVQLRFGTQGLMCLYQAGVNPLFIRWLEVQRINDPKIITHIYFNNMSRRGGGFTGKDREKGMTKQLEGLEETHQNLAMITLPAEGGLMDHHLAAMLKQKHGYPSTYKDAMTAMLKIANGTSRNNYAGDFHISERIKKLLYGDPTKENEKYDKKKEHDQLIILLTNSFKQLGFSESDTLSPSDLQAVFFHFIKFELTNFIIKTLRPTSFNFSCKDAIDRGGVSSAYYNLMKSIEAGKPITQDEFERILHGAPTLVKGRGMNYHIWMIWNVIDAYVSAQKMSGDKDKRLPPWLPVWRDKQAIPPFLQYYINELTNYIRQRKGEKENKYGWFSIGMSKKLKLDTAGALLYYLRQLNSTRRNPVHVTVDLTVDQLKAAHDARLGIIVKGLEHAGYLTLSKISASHTP